MTASAVRPLAFMAGLANVFLFLSTITAADYTSGHADLGIAYEDGEWDLHVHAEGATIGGDFYADEEFEADDVRIIVPLSALVTGAPLTAPFISDFWNIPESLGLTQGDVFFNLFQNLGDTSTTNSPFVGLAAEEIDPADFVGGVITVALTGFNGPGHFTLWQDGTGVAMDTFDGIGADDVINNFPTGAGAHTHYNYAFSAPGTYQVTLTASGTLTGGGGFSSGTGTYTFVAVPEVSTLGLCAAGAAFALVGFRRSRRTA